MIVKGSVWILTCKSFHFNVAFLIQMCYLSDIVWILCQYYLSTWRMNGSVFDKLHRRRVCALLWHWLNWMMLNNTGEWKSPFLGSERAHHYWSMHIRDCVIFTQVLFSFTNISSRKHACMHNIIVILFELRINFAFQLYYHSADILLDQAFNPKIADFGFSVEKPQISGGHTVFHAAYIARSEGYYPPEVTSGTFSDRSDVFCLGVVSMWSCTHEIIHLVPNISIWLLLRSCWKYSVASRSMTHHDQTQTWQVNLFSNH